MKTTYRTGNATTLLLVVLEWSEFFAASFWFFGLLLFLPVWDWFDTIWILQKSAMECDSKIPKFQKITCNKKESSKHIYSVSWTEIIYCCRVAQNTLWLGTITICVGLIRSISLIPSKNKNRSLNKRWKYTEIHSKRNWFQLYRTKNRLYCKIDVIENKALFLYQIDSFQPFFFFYHLYYFEVWCLSELYTT